MWQESVAVVSLDAPPQCLTSQLTVQLGHSSCDEFNCAALRLQAQMSLRLKLPIECSKFIIILPEVSCIKNVGCRNGGQNRGKQQYQVAMAVYNPPENEAMSRICQGNPNVEIESVQSKTCSMEECVKAQVKAKEQLKLKIRNARCHHYILIYPYLCIQYDC